MASKATCDHCETVATIKSMVSSQETFTEGEDAGGLLLVQVRTQDSSPAPQQQLLLYRQLQLQRHFSAQDTLLALLLH